MYTHGENRIGEVPAPARKKDAFSCIDNPFLEKAGGVDRLFAFIKKVFLLCNNGSILVSGENRFGELGLGSRTPISSFTPLLPPDIENRGIRQIFATETRTWILYNDGQLFKAGEISNGTYYPHFIPVVDANLLESGGVKKIIGDETGKWFLCENNDLFLYNKVYVFDKDLVSDDIVGLKFIKVNTDFSKNSLGIKDIHISEGRFLVICRDETLFTSSLLYPDFLPLQTVAISQEGGIDRIFPGANTFIISGNGKIFAKGCNAFGQLGTGCNISPTGFIEINSDYFTENNGVRHIYSGLDFNYVLCNNGKLFVSGIHLFPQIGTCPESINSINRRTATFKLCADSFLSLLPLQEEKDVSPQEILNDLVKNLNIYIQNKQEKKDYDWGYHSAVILKNTFEKNRDICFVMFIIDAYINKCTNSLFSNYKGDKLLQVFIKSCQSHEKTIFETAKHYASRKGFDLQAAGPLLLEFLKAKNSNSLTELNEQTVMYMLRESSNEKYCIQ